MSTESMITFEENLNQEEIKYTDRFIDSQCKVNIRIRRPFKYLKHRGPRPMTTLADVNFKNSFQNVTNKKKIEKQSNSRLLKSRKLNLPTLDISYSNIPYSLNLNNMTHSKLNAMEEENDNNIKSAGNKRLSIRTPQLINMSCFSDYTSSSPNSSRLSFTISDSPQRLFNSHTMNLIEIKKKKRISDGTLTLLHNKSHLNPHTRSFSDFGISHSSTTALKKIITTPRLIP